MKVKLDLRSVSDPALGPFAKTIYTALGTSTYVTAPNPSVAQLTTLTNNFTTALGNCDAGRAALKELITLKDNARAALEAALNTEASTVESQTGGSQAGIESAGMQVQAAPTRTTSLDKPAGFSVTMGDFPGTLDWHCDADKHAKFYVPMTTPAPVTAQSVWTTQQGSSGSSGTVGGFVSGTTVAVKLVKQGPHGLVSPPSDAITRVVP